MAWKADAAASAAFVLVVCASGGARADAVLAPGPNGGFGAFVVAGSARIGAKGGKAALDLDAKLANDVDPAAADLHVGDDPFHDARSVARLVTAADGSLDLKAALSNDGRTEALALATATLRVSSHFKGYLLLAVDDGVSVYVDGKRVFSRDVARSAHPDDDVVALDLAPGDHHLSLLLHQRGGGWDLSVRFTDEALAPARGLSLVLPGTIDEAKLAADLTSFTLDRGLGADAWSPTLGAAFAGGYPRSQPREPRVTVHEKAGAPLYAIGTGDIPLEDDGPVAAFTAHLPPLAGADLAPIEAGHLIVDVKLGAAEKSFESIPRAALRSAIAAAERAKSKLDDAAAPGDRDAARATLEALEERLGSYANKGDLDENAQLDDAKHLEEFAAAIASGKDPFLAVRGGARVAYRSPLDDKPSTFGLYIPDAADGSLGQADPDKRFPLVIALHGLNGKPMNMLRWVFGRDDDRHDGEWEDRHPPPFPQFPAFVVTPMAHFNSGYRDVGEDDVMRVLDWAIAHLPVDMQRVSVTGPSMGGIGAGAAGLHYSDRFSAAAPLCGYHSYFLRGDIASHKLRPWEHDIADERSNVSFAENGFDLPMMIVHGTKDLPVENSGVLIDRYKSLGFRLVEDHPDSGHNVWQKTYEDLKGLQWLTQWKKTKAPKHVAWKTDTLRYDGYAWLRFTKLTKTLAWATAVADVRKVGDASEVTMKTKGLDAFVIDHEADAIDRDRAVTVKVDGAEISFAAKEVIAVHREDGKWVKGERDPQGKKRGLEGPMRDIQREPMIVVYGTKDPLMTRANREVADHVAKLRPGLWLDVPVRADDEVTDEELAGRAWVLVGDAKSNALTASLDEGLPFHVTREDNAVHAGKQTFTGDELGVAFIAPNPRKKGSQYVWVLEAPTVAGTLRLMSLPELLPDFIVFDRGLAAAHGQTVLGSATTLAAGTFDEAWKLPSLDP